MNFGGCVAQTAALCLKMNARTAKDTWIQFAESERMSWKWAR
jgi:hypothetical protein